MVIRLLACDLDGTLVGEALTYTPRLLRAVQRVQERGVAVVVATGRGFPSARTFARSLGTRSPLICYQGAMLVTQEGQALYEVALSRQCLPDVFALCEEHGGELSLYYNDEIYYLSRRHERAYYERWFGLPGRQVDGWQAVPGDPIKFIAISPNESAADRLEAALRAIADGRFEVIRSHPWFVEGLAPGVSKADGLARLARHLGIVREQVMAIGDGENDISMIAWAGIGVAMGNARSGVKAVADVIAPSQAQDGAAWAIERYVLGEEP